MSLTKIAMATAVAAAVAFPGVAALAVTDSQADRREVKQETKDTLKQKRESARMLVKTKNECRITANNAYHAAIRAARKTQVEANKKAQSDHVSAMRAANEKFKTDSAAATDAAGKKLARETLVASKKAAVEAHRTAVKASLNAFRTARDTAETTRKTALEQCKAMTTAQ